jgi:hypothetical protein
MLTALQAGSGRRQRAFLQPDSPEDHQLYDFVNRNIGLLEGTNFWPDFRTMIRSQSENTSCMRCVM